MPNLNQVPRPNLAPIASNEGQDLRADNITLSFAGLHALKNLNLVIAAGGLTGLIGPNGAGKTSLVNIFTGFQQPTSGQIWLGGQKISGRPAHHIRHRGIARSFQSGRLFKDLTVRENLEVTAIGLGASRRLAQYLADEMLAWMGIAHLKHRLAGILPYTDERRVGIGRALMMSPRFLLLDEPAAGMSATEVAELATLIRAIQQEKNCGILLIEHNIGLVLELSEQIYVLDSGELIAAGTPAAIKASPRVTQAYLGTAQNLRDLSGLAGAAS
ncbi:MAG: ABC transporter ATP-binding protein [Candidatus Symbiobacter sp.]|nr:ABC transporter ATP-binding protein [Candidatus Symbiobacter sp.]